jgi:hypothetical protein
MSLLQKSAFPIKSGTLLQKADFSELRKPYPCIKLLLSRNSVIKQWQFQKWTFEIASDKLKYHP